MKFAIQWVIWGSAVCLLSACRTTPNPNKPEFETQKNYHAPAQLFDFDLGNSVLRGQSQLKQSCSVKGTSLDIRDQLSQQIRIDTFNLSDPSIFAEGSTAQDLKSITRTLLPLYQARYQAKSVSAPKVYELPQGKAVIAELNIGERQVPIALQLGYGNAYVMIYNSSLPTTPDIAQQQLQVLLKALSVPGAKLKGSQSDLPLTFDFSNEANRSNKQAGQVWQTKYCP